MTTTTSFPTPENSVIGHTRKAPEGFDEEHVSKRQKMDNEDKAAQEISNDRLKLSHQISLQQETGSQRSEQQRAEGERIFTTGIMSEKIADETTQPAAVEMSLEQLQKNVGKVFHLCKSGKIPFLLCY